MEAKKCLATPLFKLPGVLQFKANGIDRLVCHVSFGLDERGFWTLQCYDARRNYVGTAMYELDGDEILGYEGSL